MKHTKKLLALVLAMLMAFSLLAVTAAAADAEEHEHTQACSVETVQPRLTAMQCPKCGTTMDASIYEDNLGTKYVSFRCPVDKTVVDGIPWRG